MYQHDHVGFYTQRFGHCTLQRLLQVCSCSVTFSSFWTETFIQSTGAIAFILLSILRGDNSYRLKLTHFIWFCVACPFLLSNQRIWIFSNNIVTYSDCGRNEQTTWKRVNLVLTNIKCIASMEREFPVQSGLSTRKYDATQSSNYFPLEKYLISIFILFLCFFLYLFFQVNIL